MSASEYYPNNLKQLAKYNNRVPLQRIVSACSGLIFKSASAYSRASLKRPSLNKVLAK